MSDTQTATAEIVRHPDIQPAGAKHPPLMVVDPAQSANIPQRPVVAAIAKVMGEVGAVEKRGNNQFHGYKYATAADVAHALQRLMAENGLVTVQREIGVNHDNDTGILAVRYEFTVMHSSGDALDPVQMTGMSRAKDSKGGFDDKAANKCHTAARKYFLLGLYNIPSGDYPDPDADETPAGPEKKGRAAAYRDSKTPDKTPDATPAEKPKSEAPPPFSEDVIDGDGVVHTYDNLKDYMTGLRLAVSGATVAGAVWSDNGAAFASVLERARENKRPKSIAALEALESEINTLLLPK